MNRKRITPDGEIPEYMTKEEEDRILGEAVLNACVYLNTCIEIATNQGLKTIIEPVPIAFEGSDGKAKSAISFRVHVQKVGNL